MFFFSTLSKSFVAKQNLIRLSSITSLTTSTANWKRFQKSMSNLRAVHSLTAMNRCFKILQYNVHKLKNQIMISCFQNFKIENYNVLIIQKSWINSYWFIIHHFIKKGFCLIYSDFHEINDVTIKICFFVNNRILFINIETRYFLNDLIILQICINSDVNSSHMGNHYFQIHNVYNEFVIDPCIILSKLQMMLKKKFFDFNDLFSLF